MGEPIIIDPNEPSGFRPMGGDFGHYDEPLEPIEVTPRREYRDDPVDRRTSMAQRMSSMSIHEEKKSNMKVRRDSGIGRKPTDKYIMYRIEKEGEDWQYATRSITLAPQDEIARTARKGEGRVLKETANMSALRKKHLEKLVEDINADESSDYSWDPVFVDAPRQTNRSRGKIECKRMDIILAKTLSRPKPTRTRSRSVAGKLIDALEPSKSKSKDKGKGDKFEKDDKKKDKDGDSKGRDRKDSVLDDDPFQEKPLFHRTGKPMDDYGPLEYHNGGLPPEIPRDKPIGARTDEEKRRDEKIAKRSKSRPRDQGGDDGIINVSEVIAGPLDGPPANIADLLRDPPRGGSRRRKGSVRDDLIEPLEPIEVEAGRSRSRRRPSVNARSRSRLRSQSRPESIRFPPNYMTRSYMGDSAGSSISSDESRYGLDREERSSYTSQDTYHSMTGRGSRYADDHGYSRPYKREKEYKEHHRGPSASRQYAQGQRGSRRFSRGYSYDAIPESRQIDYYPPTSGAMVRRRSDYAPGDDLRSPRSRPVELHYPNEMVDLKARDREHRAEGYMRDAVRDQFMDQREMDIRRREQAIDEQEWEDERRRREAEDRRREDDAYYSSRRYRGDDDGYRGGIAGGGYYH